MGGEWRPTTIGDLAAVRSDRVMPSSPSDEPYVGLEHIETDSGRLIAVGRAGDTVSLKTPFKVGDILYGKLRPALRKVLRAPICGLASTEILAVVPKLTSDGPFLKHILHSDQVLTWALQGAEGTKMPRTSWDRLSRFEFVCPPLEERAAIAETLDAIDEAIEKTEAVIAATEDLRKALLQELLTRGVPGWHTEWKTLPGIGAIPACWDVVRLGECGTWRSGGTPAKNRPEYWTGELPWVSPKDMKRREISDAIDHLSETGAQAGSRIVDPGTIFMVVRGMILAHSFPVAITRRRCAFNQDIKALVCHRDMSPEFLVAVLESRKAELVELPTPSTHGTMRIITEELQSVVVPKPKSQEQDRIAELVATVDSRTASELKHLDELRRAKGLWADGLLSGRVRVPHWEVSQ